MYHVQARIICLLLVSLLGVTATASTAFAQQFDPKALQPRPNDYHTKSIARLRPKPAPCSEFGSGYVRLESTGSCVRLGGAADVGIGGSR